MNDNVLRCCRRYEEDSYGFVRRLALMTVRLPVPSSLTLNGLEGTKKS